MHNIVLETLNPELALTKAQVFDPCGLSLSHLYYEKESDDYAACTFELNGQTIKYRCAKITPKKTGQFVTCWKRSADGITQPFDASDGIRFFVIDVSKNGLRGQFVFPETELYRQGIMASQQAPGKRGFRVYPAWDPAENVQARKTQAWQLMYFIEIPAGGLTDLSKAKALYSIP